ncbi:MAG TPA: ABC transporter permease [Candidatus Kapabacteria bacterium]|nr:ABC transporter permease [Candidatus Kapabacteria bacterium]
MAVESFIARRYFLGMGKMSLLAIFILVIIPTPLDVLLGLIALIVAMVRGRRISLVTIISVISLLGIKVGVGALICVLSVFNGFNGIVRGLFVGFDPHVRVTPVVETTFRPDSLLHIISAQPEVTAAAPFVSGRSAVIHREGLKVVQIRGMRPEDISTAIGLGNKIYNGSFRKPTAAQPHPIVLGAMLSYALNAAVGDTISVLSQSGIEETMTQLAQPTIVQCIVTGTFESNNKEYDENYAYTDIATAREIFAVPDGAMGIEIRLKDFESAPAVQARLQHIAGGGFRVETWQDLHRDLFAVMELERWAAFIILSLIIIVAVFNVLGSLTMTVIEKRRDIGILKTMGASDRTIMRTYLFEGGLVGIIGTLGGVFIGIGTCLMQIHFGLFKLNNAVYIIPALPVELRGVDILVISTTSMLLALVAALYPALRASRLLPADAVRWE